MKRGALIAAVVLAIGAFACERKLDDTKAGDTTTTSGTVHEEQSTGSGTGYQGSPGITGGGTTSADQAGGTGSGLNSGNDLNTGSDRNANTGASNNAGSMGANTGTGSTLSADQSGSTGAKDAGIASDFEKKDGGHVDINSPSTGSSKAKSGTENKSTTLGDGTSGQYTGGKGTYGGKATQGTGDKK
jgi:hypothetical protein